MNKISLGDLQQKQKQVGQKGAIDQLLAFLNKDISLSGEKLNDRQKEYFYLESAILLKAGVDIKTTLELVASSNQIKGKANGIFEQLKERIITGMAMSEAMKASGVFSAYEYYSVQIGEETGKLSIVLEGLASYYKKKIKQRRQIISALSYPMIVLLTSIGAVLFMIGYIVPMFADVFKQSGGDLPLVTAIIIRLSEVIGGYFYVFVLVAAAIGSLLYINRKKALFRKTLSTFLLKIPLLGEMLQKIYLAQFCHSMSLLIGAKVPILRALAMIEQMIGFYPIEVSLQPIEAQIQKGITLHESMTQFPIYPVKMVMLIKVGEEVNQLEYFFTMIAEQYNQEVEYQTGIISSMLEPLIIVFLGLVVGVILIAMYLPLFKLGMSF